MALRTARNINPEKGENVSSFVAVMGQLREILIVYAKLRDVREHRTVNKRSLS